jgi:hypothetical protein
MVRLTPDVPNPADAGFLSSLLNDPRFRLTWVGKGSDHDVELELSGPGTNDACVRVIDGMRRDARIVLIQIQGGTS